MCINIFNNANQRFCKKTEFRSERKLNMKEAVKRRRQQRQKRQMRTQLKNTCRKYTNTKLTSTMQMQNEHVVCCLCVSPMQMQIFESVDSGCQAAAEKTKAAAAKKKARAGGTPGGANNDDPGDPGVENQKWFDDTKTNKSERTYAKMVDLLKVQFDQTDKAMGDALSAFRASKDTNAFCVEMSLVMKRQKWLHAIMDKDSSTLQKMIAEGSAESKDDTASESAASPAKGSSPASKDLSALVRAGPCPNYEQFVIFATLEKHKGTAAKSCSDAPGLSEWVNAMNEHKKLYGIFLNACKLSITDLYQAKKTQKEVADEKKRIETEAAKDKKRSADGHTAAARKRTAISGIALLNLEAHSF